MGEVFLKNRFGHELFAFIFESKHKINADLRRLINICVRGENELIYLQYKTNQEARHEKLKKIERILQSVKP